MKWGEYVLGPSLLVYANAMYDYQTKKKEKKLGQYIGPRAKMTFLFCAIFAGAPSMKVKDGTPLPISHHTPHAHVLSAHCAFIPKPLLFTQSIFFLYFP